MANITNARLEMLTEDSNRMYAMVDACREFQAYLASDKFRGEDVDGERKDWIATIEVHTLLYRLQLIATLGAE